MVVSRSSLSFDIGSSAVAEAAGLGDQLGFFLMTGTGDFAGVLAGHCCFYGIKKVAFDDSISMSDTFQVGVWLASAAFMSGFAWQPAVNAFQAPGNAFGFNTAVALTTVVCGTVFYTGCATRPEDACCGPTSPRRLSSSLRVLLGCGSGATSMTQLCPHSHRQITRICAWTHALSRDWRCHWLLLGRTHLMATPTGSQPCWHRRRRRALLCPTPHTSALALDPSPSHHLPLTCVLLRRCIILSLGCDGRRF